jgi:Fe-S-cluster-containing hydrogenase component 2
LVDENEMDLLDGSARMGVLLFHAVEAAHGEAKADVQCNVCMTELPCQYRCPHWASITIIVDVVLAWSRLDASE